MTASDAPTSADPPQPPQPPVPPDPPDRPAPPGRPADDAGRSEPRRKAVSVPLVAGVAIGLVALVTVIAILLWPTGPPVAGPVARTEPEAPLVTEAGAVPLPLDEDPRDFAAGFTTAVQDGDVGWLLTRLHPAVIQRYGEAQCRDYIRSSVLDPTMRLQVSAVTGPGAWVWSSDDRSTSVDEVYRIDAHRFLRGSETTGNLWLANVDARLTWFADCGTPQRG